MTPLNNAPCYEPSGRQPEELGDSKALLESICPKFVKKYDGKSCCSQVQVEDLNVKFVDMYESYFQECPACLRSQLEYYW